MIPCFGEIVNLQCPNCGWFPTHFQLRDNLSQSIPAQIRFSKQLDEMEKLGLIQRKGE